MDNTMYLKLKKTSTPFSRIFSHIANHKILPEETLILDFVLDLILDL